VEWQFCPRCETQLQGERPVCPACGYDPDEPAAEPDPDAGIPYSEKYRELTFVSVVEAHRPRHRINRTRLLVAIALLVVTGLYASMLAVSDLRARAGAATDPPARIVTRP
jgi:hypothetical protein